MPYCHPTNSANSGWTRPLLMIVALCVLASWPALAQGPGSAPGDQNFVSSGGSVTLAGHTPSQVLQGTAITMGPYNPQQKLRLALAVQPPHMAEEEEFIQELETKGSPNFHQFLTAEEWNARFAPSAEDEQKVVDWATSQGLTVTNRFANRLLVDVEAPVEVIERAFGVNINNYQVGNEVDFANDRDPIVPFELSGILYSVLGLNSIDRVHGGMPETRNAKGPDYVAGPVYAEGISSHGDGDPAKSPDAVRAAIANGLPSPRPGFTNNKADPGDIFSSEAYNWDGLQRFSHCCNVHNDSTGSPAVSSIALATYAGFNQSDVNTFFQMYGFAWNYTAYNINGASGVPGTKCVVGSSGCSSVAVDDEATLDTEYSTATSNSYGSYLDTAHVYIYEGANQLFNTITDLFNFMVSDGHARVMSTSWSQTESTSGNQYTYYEVPAHAIFNTMSGEGWTLVGDADDQGSTGNCSTISVNFPASDNNFVAAGGTALELYSNGQWDYEVAWTGGTGPKACQTNNGGGGGGISVLWPQPFWQSDYSAVKALGSMRLEPDLALNAGGIGQNYYYNGKLSGVGGTSIVAPELAGFFAQENTYLNYIGPICGSGTSNCTPVGNPNPFIYYAGGSGAPHNPFYDITRGCTSNNITAANHLTPWCAGTGFDLATGWGSANMMQLAWAINWELLPAYGNPSVAFSGPARSTWYNTSQRVDWTVSDAGSGGFPAPGVAGFTQGWDSIPADPQSEPHGGSGNSFYSGPEYAFGKTGCLSFVAGSCSGGVSQGCHTVHVEGWDNQGRTTFGTYGPLCYDTVSPVATASLSGTLSGSDYKNTATVTITATDAGSTATPQTGSGVKNIHYQLNGGTLTSYSAPFAVGTNGANTVKYYATDKAGNVESTKTLTFGITDTTSTSFKSSGSPSGLGKPVTFTADVTPASGLATGNVTFKDGTTVLGTVALSGGVAKFTTSALALGSHSIAADFLGSTYFLASVSGAQTQVVKNDSTTVVNSSANPSNYGETVTFTATVTHTATPIPTGTVTFKAGTTVLASVAVGATGTAKYSTSALAVGTHSITAVYSGDSNYIASTSAPLSQVVDKAATTTTVVSSLNPSTTGDAVTFTATVKVTAPGAGTPAAMVTFKDGSTTLGTATPNGSGKATFATSTLAAGTHSITAVFAGGVNFSTSTSAVLSQKVNP
jgi:Pro-kumamolisin, activation domain/Bacterial Ig-like domain (group 3)